MAEDEESNEWEQLVKKEMKAHNYYVYITTNPRKTVLYTGVTNHLRRRMHRHEEDRRNGAKTFAARYFCLHLLYYEEYGDVKAAIAREKEIKGWRRSKKLKLIETMNPNYKFLNDDINE